MKRTRGIESDKKDSKNKRLWPPNFSLPLSINSGPNAFLFYWWLNSSFFLLFIYLFVCLFDRNRNVFDQDDDDDDDGFRLVAHLKWYSFHFVSLIQMTSYNSLYRITCCDIMTSHEKPLNTINSHVNINKCISKRNRHKHTQT